MKSKLAPLTPLLCAALLTAGAADFKPMFNGRDLEGWVNVNCAPETWSVKDGVIHCTGKPIGALRTAKQYENFVFELEWRHLRAGGNAGVFIWASPLAAKGQPFLRAIEVQVLDHGYNSKGKNEWYTTHGDVFPIHGSTMKPFGRHNGQRSFPAGEHSKGSPEWNHYKIECRDGVLWLWVNGHKVSGGENCNWRRGYLALESEGSPVEFRNLRIQELPGSFPQAEDTAPEAEGHRPLYNGVDLRGWTLEGKGEKRWTSSDWRLINKGGAGAGQTLWTTGRHGDYELIFDCRTISKDPKPFAEVLLRDIAGDDATLPLTLPLTLSDTAQGSRLRSPKLTAGAWHRFQIQVKGRAVSVRVNDGDTVDSKLPESAAGPSRIALRDLGQPVELANLYLRALP